MEKGGALEIDLAPLAITDRPRRSAEALAEPDRSGVPGGAV
jgi:hypothetical protein